MPLERIEQLYGLNLSFVEKIAGGFLSDNFALTDGTQKYFLKKHRHTDEAQVRGVCLAEQFYAEGGIPVILPIPTRDGGEYFMYEQGFYSLYPFVEGRHIERGMFTKEATVSFGKTLALLHMRGKDSTLPVLEKYAQWNKEKFLAKTGEIEAEIAKNKNPIFDAMALENLMLKKRLVIENEIRYAELGLTEDHLVHGDYFCDNVFFGDDNQVSHVFDFEKVQYASAPTELFRGMFVSFFSIPTQDNLELAKLYVDSYLKAYPQPTETVQNALTAAALKQMHSIFIEEEHYLKNSNRMDPLLPSQLALNTYYLLNHKKIGDYLLGNAI